MLGNTILLLLLVVGLGLKSISSSTFVEALEICLDSKCDVKIGMQFCMNTQMAKMNTHTLSVNIKKLMPILLLIMLVNPEKEILKG